MGPRRREGRIKENKNTEDRGQYCRVRRRGKELRAVMSTTARNLWGWERRTTALGVVGVGVAASQILMKKVG